MGSQYAEGLAVRRPVEIDNQLGVEICDLAARGAVQRLEPDIVNSIFPDGVGQ